MNQLEEVKAYLYELSTRNTLDPEVIQNLRPEVLGEISLRVSHLKSLIAALEAVLEACTKVDRESSEAEQDWLAWAIETAIKEALQ